LISVYACSVVLQLLMMVGQFSLLHILLVSTSLLQCAQWREHIKHLCADFTCKVKAYCLLYFW